MRGCEGEMWEWMEFYYYSPSETFVVQTADQFVGRDDGLLEQQRQDRSLVEWSLVNKLRVNVNEGYTAEKK